MAFFSRLLCLRCSGGDGGDTGWGGGEDEAAGRVEEESTCKAAGYIA